MIVQWLIEKFYITSIAEREVYDYLKNVLDLIKIDKVKYIDYDNSMVDIYHTDKHISIHARCSSMTSTRIFDVYINDYKLPSTTSIHYIVTKLYEFCRSHYCTYQKDLEFQKIAQIIK